MKNLATVNFTDTVLTKLQSTYSVMIFAHATAQRVSGSNTYLIIALNKNKWYKIEYKNHEFISSTDTIKHEIQKQEIRKSLGDSIFKVFRSANFPMIKETDEGCDWDMTVEERKKINCGVRDAETLAITLYIKGKAVTKTYSGPEYWLCCEGKDDRIKFIQCKNALFSVAKRE